MTTERQLVKVLVIPITQRDQEGQRDKVCIISMTHGDQNGHQNRVMSQGSVSSEVTLGHRYFNHLVPVSALEERRPAVMRHYAGISENIAGLIENILATTHNPGPVLCILNIFLRHRPSLNSGQRQIKKRD